MRISSAQLYQNSLTAMLDNQSTLSRTQLQLSTGRRILTPADDPAGSATVLDLNQAIESTHQYQRNADSARGRLELEESTLGSVGDILQRVRELTLQANNDTQSSDTRRYIAFELRERRKQLIDLANLRDASGEYLFAGSRGSVQPFQVAASGQVAYAGDQSSRNLQIGPSQQIADGDAGSDVFVGIRNGNGTFTTLDNPANSGSGVIDPGAVSGTYVADTYTISFTQVLPTDPITYSVTGAVSGVVVAAGTPYSSGAQINFNGVSVSVAGTPADTDSFTVAPSANQDLFTTVQNLVTALESSATTNAGQAQFHNAVNRGIVDLDQGMDNIIEIRARAGARLNTLDSQKGTNETFLLQAQQSLSEVQDLDYAEAASRLNRQLLSLEAAQQTFTRVQGLSLFNFLR